MQVMKDYESGYWGIIVLYLEEGFDGISVGDTISFDPPITGDMCFHFYEVAGVEKTKYRYRVEVVFNVALKAAIKGGQSFRKASPVKPATSFSHYSYLSGPDFMREPTGLMDLRVASVATRRKLVHSLLKNGELLASLPFPEIGDMVQLRKALAAEMKLKQRSNNA